LADVGAVRKTIKENKTKMKAAIVGDVLVILLQLNDPIEKSASGKTFVVASSHGNRRTAVKMENSNVIVNANAYIRPERKLKQRNAPRRRTSTSRRSKNQKA